VPFYHATRRTRLESILQTGLQPVSPQNFDCPPGVYLSDSPIVAFGFLIEHFLINADDSSRPSEEVKDFVVIVIDDSRINSKRLLPDPNVSGKWQKHLFIYDNIIDVTGMPILDADDLFPKQEGDEERH
jgi:hypothetical protein